jgi:DNA-binding MarR family transcriptional regulator
MNATARTLLLEARRLAEATHEAQAALLAQMGLHAFERRLLELLACAGQGLTARRAARATLCPLSTVESSLRALHARGWVDVVRHDSRIGDRHVLSASGRSARHRVRQAERRLDDVLDAGLDAGATCRAIELLRAARRRLDDLSQAPPLRPPSSRAAVCSSEALSATASAA